MPICRTEIPGKSSSTPSIYFELAKACSKLNIDKKNFCCSCKNVQHKFGRKYSMKCHAKIEKSSPQQTLKRVANQNYLFENNPQNFKLLKNITNFTHMYRFTSVYYDRLETLTKILPKLPRLITPLHCKNHTNKTPLPTLTPVEIALHIVVLNRKEEIRDKA